jgi:hypothetical protein
VLLINLLSRKGFSPTPLIFIAVSPHISQILHKENMEDISENYEK